MTSLRSIIVSLCFISSVSFAAQRVDQTLDVAAGGFVKFENVNGEVRFHAWQQDKVRVTGELDERLDKFIFERSGKQVVIKVKLKKESSWNWNSASKGDNLDIYLPANHHLEIDSVNTDISLGELNNGLDVELVNGDLTVNDVTGKIRIITVNGDINSRGLKGDVSFESVNGDIQDSDGEGSDLRFTTVNGDVRSSSRAPVVSLTTVNGDGKLTLAQVNELTLKTVNGDFNVSAEPGSAIEIEGSSVGGDIHLQFDGELSARVEVDSHGGKIINKLTDDAVVRAKYGPNRSLHFLSAGGQGKVKLTTVNGKITLE